MAVLLACPNADAAFSLHVGVHMAAEPHRLEPWCHEPWSHIVVAVCRSPRDRPSVLGPLLPQQHLIYGSHAGQEKEELHVSLWAVAPRGKWMVRR